MFLLVTRWSWVVPGVTDPAADFIVRMTMCIARRVVDPSRHWTASRSLGILRNRASGGHERGLPNEVERNDENEHHRLEHSRQSPDDRSKKALNLLDQRSSLERALLGLAVYTQMYKRPPDLRNSTPCRRRGCRCLRESRRLGAPASRLRSVFRLARAQARAKANGTQSTASLRSSSTSSDSQPAFLRPLYGISRLS